VIELAEPEPKTVRSFDGTLLAARRFAGGEGVPLLISNAVGANVAAWRRVLIDVTRDRPVVMWDHRGLLESSPPASDRIDPGAHAEDATAVLSAFDYDEVHLAGWSNGSRIAVEIAARNPERIKGMVLVCPHYGHPLSRLVTHLELGSVLPSVMGAAKHFAGYLETPFRALVSRPEVSGLIRQSGLIAAVADTRGLVELLRGLASCDLKQLLATYEAVSGDSAPELLRHIQSPTVLIAGQRDIFASPSMAQEMERMIPDASLEIYEKATHYLPLEYPAMLSDDMRRFFKNF
jgi:3-oxoadipate enol-lactonase